MSILPDWYLPGCAPDGYNIPWATGAWSQDAYDKTLVGDNYPGVLGDYHPVIHYITREEFEALGDTITPGDVPEWTFENLKGLLLAILSGLMLLTCKFSFKR